MTTLRRELRTDFEEILTIYNNLPVTKVAELLADAALKVSYFKKEKKTDEEQANYNLTYRGDFREYPEHLWNIAQALQTHWAFALPPKPQKRQKGSEYNLYISAMEGIKQAAGEFDAAELLANIRKQFEASMKKNNGVAPFTVGKPTALITSVTAEARERRAKGTQEVKERKRYTTGEFAEFLANNDDEEEGES